jgi:Mg2+ and Co2+ transporter CorA
MDVHVVSDQGIQQHPVGELERLLARDDGLVWVDIPVADEGAARVLSEVFDFHSLAIRACIERNAVPKVRAYRDHIFVIRTPPSSARVATSTTSSWTSSSALATWSPSMVR